MQHLQSGPSVASRAAARRSPSTPDTSPSVLADHDPVRLGVIVDRTDISLPQQLINQRMPGTRSRRSLISPSVPSDGGCREPEFDGCYGSPDPAIARPPSCGAPPGGQLILILLSAGLRPEFTVVLSILRKKQVLLLESKCPHKSAVSALERHVVANEEPAVV